MKIESPSIVFMLAVLLASVVAHGLLTVTFAVSAGMLMAASSGAYATGSQGDGILLMAAVLMLLSGYFRAGNVASAEIARAMTWLFYGEWVPR
ncbi:hypothetical protein ACQZ6F_19020 [Rhizobium sp. A22-96]